MKKVIITFLIFAIGSSLFYQCSDEEIFTASQAIQPVLLNVDVPNEVVLDPQFSDATAINFSWQEADYAQPTQINYILELDDEEAFNEPITVSQTTQQSVALTVSQLNNAVGTAGLAPFQTGSVFARIRSTIGSEGALEQLSNVISFNVFPYTTALPRLYIVGAYQSVSGYGTTNAEAPTLASSEFGSESDYEGFAYFGGSDLEFQLHRSGFVGEYVEGNPIYGSDGGAVVEGASGSFSVPSEGYYWITVNLDTNAISLTETNWGIAGPGGPAGGWPETPPDADMTYDIENRIWVFENASTSNGEFKFRANDAWGINLGTDDNGDGALDFNGPNMNNDISASRFVLDLSNARGYSFSISNP